jgi:hypothetical protein
MSALDWLLDSDPAIRWQTMRDLTDASASTVAVERARVATEGWGKRLLDLQHPKNQWSDGSMRSLLQSPDGSACYALNLLCDMGIDPECEQARCAVKLIRDNITHYEGGQPYFSGETEPCINGRVLGQGACFGEPNAALLDRLLSEQLPDGGWNCEAPKTQRSSFNTTICVLEGLLEYGRTQGADPRIAKSRSRGEEYLLERRLLRSLRTGELINLEWALFSYPNDWRYDVLRALDYLRRAGVKPDGRIAEALELVEKNRSTDGRWALQSVHKQQLAFEMGQEVGKPSPWITLRALRVLQWAEVG